MKEGSEQEKKDKKFSMIMSAIVHGTLLVIFLLLVAWREPDPPIAEYGMEINLGFQAEGFGDTEREIDNPTQETENDTPPESETDTEETQEEPVEETPEEVVEETTETQETEQPAKETEPAETAQEKVEDPVEEVADPVEATQETASEVKAEEEKKEEVKEEEEETKPPVEETKEVTPPVEEKKEEVKPKPKPKPTVDNRALLGAKKSDTNSTDPASSNQGKTLDARGNMGKPEGKPNTDGQVPGGADFGVSLSLDGWQWDRPPAEKDDSQIDGIIKFRIQVDDRGDVMTVTKMPGTTISDNTIVDFYKKQVQKLIFIRTDKTKAAAAISKGEITFVIKTK